MVTLETPSPIMICHFHRFQSVLKSVSPVNQPNGCGARDAIAVTVGEIAEDQSRYWHDGVEHKSAWISAITGTWSMTNDESHSGPD